MVFWGGFGGLGGPNTSAGTRSVLSGPDIKAHDRQDIKAREA